jgi:hypothetical protein
MAALPAISLDDNWFYQHFSPAHNTEGAIWVDGRRGPLSILSDWSGLEDPQGVAWLTRSFTLMPTDTCVRYYLHVVALPGVERITINDHEINLPTRHPPFRFDVTDFVTLGGNLIGFYAAGTGAFGHIHLQPIPCDKP